MKNKYLSTEVGATEFNNFFHKLEHSISIANTHGIISDSKYEKARNRLVKKFLSSLEKGKYKSLRPMVIKYDGEEYPINTNDVIELLDVDKSANTIIIAFDECKYNLGFSVMLNFEPVPIKG